MAEKSLSENIIETSNLKPTILTPLIVSQIEAAIEKVREGKPNTGFILKPIGHKVSAIEVLAWANVKSLI